MSVSAEVLEQSIMYRVMRTVFEMCADRKMPIADEWLPKSMDDFRIRYCIQGKPQRSKMFAVCHAEFYEDDSKNGEPCMNVHFHEAETNDGVQRKISVEDINTYIKQARDCEVNHVLIVYKGALNVMAKKLIENQKNDDVWVECFDEQKLVINITRHDLVPKHEPLTPEEVKEVLSAHSITKVMLPRILSSDPVVQYFGLKPGQVVKITRKSETAGIHVTYRRVI